MQVETVLSLTQLASGTWESKWKGKKEVIVDANRRVFRFPAPMRVPTAAGCWRKLQYADACWKLGFANRKQHIYMRVNLRARVCVCVAHWANKWNCLSLTRWCSCTSSWTLTHFCWRRWTNSTKNREIKISINCNNGATYTQGPEWIESLQVHRSNGLPLHFHPPYLPCGRVHVETCKIVETNACATYCTRPSGFDWAATFGRNTSAQPFHSDSRNFAAISIFAASKNKPETTEANRRKKNENFIPKRDAVDAGHVVRWRRSTTTLQHLMFDGVYETRDRQFSRFLLRIAMHRRNLFYGCSCCWSCRCCYNIAIINSFNFFFLFLVESSSIVVYLKSIIRHVLDPA